MYLYMLKADRSVEVVEHPNFEGPSIVKKYPKNQIFIRGLFSWNAGWHCLQRESASWAIAKKIPEEVLLAHMIVN